MFWTLDRVISNARNFLHTENMNESITLYNDTYTAINITMVKKLVQILGGTIWIDCNGLTGSGIYFFGSGKNSC